MIYDNIKNAQRYSDFTFVLSKISEYSKKAVGKYELDGNNLFINVNSYETAEKEVDRFENHHKYIDVQYIVSGSEKILVGEKNEAFLYEKYREEADVEFYKFNDRYTEIILLEGDFLILFPGETHDVGFCVDKPDVVNKIVAKVHI